MLRQNRFLKIFIELDEYRKKITQMNGKKNKQLITNFENMHFESNTFVFDQTLKTMMDI